MVAVCVVPADLRPEVDDLTGAVTADSRRVDLVAAEAAALEHGLRIASAWSGWVLVVAAGPASVAGVLGDAAALGAEVVRVEPDGSPSDIEPGSAVLHGSELAGDPASLARALAGAILSRGAPRLVICGDRSGVHGVGAVPGFLAHELAVDQALGVVSVSPSGDGVVVERRLDGGWRERLSVRGPAVISVEGAGVRLRRAPLSAALEAGALEIPVYSAAAGAPGAGGPGAGGAGGGGAGGLPLAGAGRLPPAGAGRLQVGASRPYRPRPRPVDPPVGDARQRLLTLSGALINREPPRIVGPVGAAAAADELLSFLERNGYRQAE